MLMLISIQEESTFVEDAVEVLYSLHLQDFIPICALDDLIRCER